MKNPVFALLYDPSEKSGNHFNKTRSLLRYQHFLKFRFLKVLNTLTPVPQIIQVIKSLYHISSLPDVCDNVFYLFPISSYIPQKGF